MYPNSIHDRYRTDVMASRGVFCEYAEELYACNPNLEPGLHPRRESIIPIVHFLQGEI